MHPHPDEGHDRHWNPPQRVEDEPQSLFRDWGCLRMCQLSRVQCCWRRGLVLTTWASDRSMLWPVSLTIANSMTSALAEHAMDTGELAHLQTTPIPEQRERDVTNSLLSVDHKDQPSFIIALLPPTFETVYTFSLILLCL